MEERQPSCTVGGNINWYSYYGEQSLFSNVIEKDTCIPVFIAALFTIARTQKQPKCPLTDEWVKKLWHIYIMECYSATKRTHLSQFQWGGWTQSILYTVKYIRKRKTSIIYDTYIWNLQRGTYFQGSRGDTDMKNRPVDTAGEGDGGTNWE